MWVSTTFPSPSMKGKLKSKVIETDNFLDPTKVKGQNAMDRVQRRIKINIQIRYLFRKTPFRLWLVTQTHHSIDRSQRIDRIESECAQGKHCQIETVQPLCSLFGHMNPLSLYKVTTTEIEWHKERYVTQSKDHRKINLRGYKQRDSVIIIGMVRQQRGRLLVSDLQPITTIWSCYKLTSFTAAASTVNSILHYWALYAQQ